MSSRVVLLEGFASTFDVHSSSCCRFDPLYFLANFWFRKNFGSIPLVDTNFDRLAFLMPLRCALCVELCAHVFFCCATERKKNDTTKITVRRREVTPRRDCEGTCRFHASFVLLVVSSVDGC